MVSFLASYNICCGALQMSAANTKGGNAEGIHFLSGTKVEDLLCRDNFLCYGRKTHIKCCVLGYSF